MSLFTFSSKYWNENQVIGTKTPKAAAKAAPADRSFTFPYSAVVAASGRIIIKMKLQFYSDIHSINISQLKMSEEESGEEGLSEAKNLGRWSQPRSMTAFFFKSWRAYWLLATRLMKRRTHYKPIRGEHLQNQQHDQQIKHLA